MDKYCRPEIKVYTTAEILEVFGPGQAQSGTVTVYGGGSAMLNNSQKAEYRFVKADLNYSIITEKEVSHA